MKATIDRLKWIVSQQLGIDVDEITDDASLRDDLGADSLDVVELVMGAEEEFGIDIDDEKAAAFVRFSDLRVHVEATLRQKGAA
jgi:acyl carrier protein